MGAYPHSETAPRPGNGGSAAPAPIPPRGPAWGYPHSGSGASHSRGWVAEWALSGPAAVMLWLRAVLCACVNVMNLIHTQP
jgi:hypothetical protein